MNNQQSVAAIEQAMKVWAEALKRKDINAMLKDYADHYRIYDVMETGNSVEAFKKMWEDCFPYFDEPTVQYKNLVIEATEEMGVAYFNSQIQGINVPLPDEMRNTWLRATVVYRKENGVWKCIHEHISFPVNCETNQIAFDKAQ